MSFTVRNIYEKFEVLLKLLDGEKNLDRTISKPGLSRATFELVDLFESDHINNVIVFGNREFKYLSSLTVDERRKRVTKILELKPPMVILTKSFLDSSFLTECNIEQQIPILASDMFSTEISISIGLYISEQLAKFKTYHGVLIEVYGEGVLITGESGIGKSEVAMEMIRKNCLFIADDAVDIARIGDHLIGKPTDVNRQFIEVRGIGILNVTKMYGIEKIKPSANISVIIQLINIKNDQNFNFERIGQKTHYKVIENIKIPHYVLPISSGRKISELVESAVIDLKLKRDWQYNSGDDFVARFDEIMRGKK
ncbi:HPr(Ser) kinase/phosphatase [Mycoplasma bradburyae]|uniref:HPr kinase/phosphorylase n=1 Tax=Mycoplasma bradburyae TaxID=2963128 RepID=A0AAW6HP42_9MOLU|nr:HPr(Ser) kinase/phosphatase [Mycoplasma bradburyae]MDC4183192.1 HPr(Ser) kinase/phosphatase [Mycoplasma bradburyae]